MAEKKSMSNKVMAIIIIVAMIGSTIAFGVLSFNDTPTAENNDVPLLNPESQTALNYTASNVEATVLQLMPAMRVFADTNRTDIDEMDSEIRSIDEVTGIQSQFQNPQPGQKNVTYMAELSFQKDADAQSVVKNISEMPGIEGIQAIRLGLVELPKKVELFNKDLNFSESHEFKDNLSQAWLEISTLKGDKIESELQITLLGKELTEIMAFETKNLDNQFESHKITKTLKVASLLKKITMNADYNVSQDIDVNGLKKQISQLKDINADAVELDEKIPSLELAATIANDSNIPKSDLNNALMQVAGVTGVSFSDSDNPINAVIEFENEKELNALKQDIVSKLNSLKIDSKSIELVEPVASLNAEIGLTSENGAIAFNGLKDLLESKNLNPKILQSADFNAGFLEDSNKQFSLDSNSISAEVFPIHSVGDEVELEISFYSQRNKVVFVTGIKEPEKQ